MKLNAEFAALHFYYWLRIFDAAISAKQTKQLKMEKTGKRGRPFGRNSRLCNNNSVIIPDLRKGLAVRKLVKLSPQMNLDEAETMNDALVDQYHTVCERSGTYPVNRYAVQLSLSRLCLHLKDALVTDDIRGVMALMKNKNTIKRLAVESQLSAGRSSGHQHCFCLN